MTTPDPAMTALLGVIGAILAGNVWNWLASRGKTKVDLIGLAQSIAAETIKALDTRIAQLEATIEDQGIKIEELIQHVGKLEDIIIGFGGTPPPRPRKKAGA